jgi:hypothetical protein
MLQHIAFILVVSGVGLMAFFATMFIRYGRDWNNR